MPTASSLVLALLMGLCNGMCPYVLRRLLAVIVSLKSDTIDT
jgi:hypothetical protein